MLRLKVIWKISENNTWQEGKEVASLQPANEEEKSEKGRQKGQTKIKKIKFAKIKKVATFAVPKERGAEKRKVPEAISDINIEKLR